MIDKEELVQSLTPSNIIEIMRDLGCDDYIEKDNYIIFRTICHHHDQEDGNHKLYYYKNTKLFVCYSECGTFDIIQMMVKRFELLDLDYNFYSDILLKLADYSQFNITHQRKDFFNDKYKSIQDRYKKKEPQVIMPALDPSILTMYSSYPAVEWLDDGISEEAMRRYSIKYSPVENKIIIPHYNIKGQLIGIRARHLNKEDLEYGKYMPVSIGKRTLSHPLGYNLYGLNLVKGNIKRIGMAIIGESEKFTLQYDTMFGHHDNICVATCGSSLHKYQINLLIAAGAKKILLAYDKEGTTLEEENKYYQKLYNICNRYKNIVEIGYIRDTDSLLELKDSPTDKGKETFLKLYWKNTIWL